MAQVTLYGTTGTYPSLAKDATDTKYIFWPEPTFKWNFTKKTSYEDIPFLATSVAYDPFTMDRVLTIKGTFKATGAGDPPGAKTLKERFEDLDKWNFHFGTFSSQPNASNASEEIFCLEITFPDASVKQHFVVFHNLSVDWGGGTTHLAYTLTLKEASELYLV